LLGLVTEFLVRFIPNISSLDLSFLNVLLPTIITSAAALLMVLKYKSKYPLVAIGLSELVIYIIDSFIGPDKAIADACFNLNLIEFKITYLSCAITTLISQAIFFLLPFLVITY